MLRSQKSKLKSYHAIQEVMRDWEPVWTGQPSISRCMSLLNQCVEEIEAAYQAQQTQVRVITAQKEKYKSRLRAQVKVIAGSVYAVALELGDTVLLELCALTSGRLQRMDESDLIQYSRMLWQRLSEFAAGTGGMNALGITQQDLDSLANLLNQSGAEMSAPRAAIAGRKGHTERIPNLIVRCDKLIRYGLRPLVSLHGSAEPAFVQALEAASRVFQSSRSRKGGEDAENAA